MYCSCIKKKQCRDARGILKNNNNKKEI
jgi:hypothetical protein